jgi:S1/P1 Nuclease
MPRKWFPLTLALLCLVAIPSATFAWNFTGHRVIASIAYRQLDEPTKKRIAEVLKKHPAYVELWANRDTNGPDEVLNLFWNASVFPDDARHDPWRKFNRPMAHYVNYRILADQGNKVEPPLGGENILNSYVAHLKQIQDPRTPIETKAVHLSWIFHQAGDIHQPLHAVARFSKALPRGDRGGNEVTFPNPRNKGGRPSNLHAYWDDLIGTDTNPASVERLADEILKDDPVATLAAELGKTNVRNWAEESVEICLKTVYKNLDAEITQFVDLPVGYDADAQRVARRRVALAGYRLAGELKRLFAEQ